MNPPDLDKSTTEERKQYIKETFACKSKCELCGLCKVFKGKSAEVVYADYIEGIRDFNDINKNVLEKK